MEAINEQEVGAYAYQLAVVGVAPLEIRDRLMDERGLTEAEATDVVRTLNVVPDATASQEEHEYNFEGQRRSEATKNMIVGGLWCVGGIAITAATYSSADGGGTYVVAWGAIIFGAIQFFRGAANLND